MKFILGTKQYMTQIFDDKGVAYPATVLSVGPVTVTQVKSLDKDNYQAIQVGYGERSEKNINQAQRGHIKDLGLFRYSKEFRSDNENGEEYSRGDIIDVSKFEVGDVVEVSSISKGKGFQGVVKRHGFAGGPRTHGNKHHERTPGSIGAQGPQRVLKGVRMAGRMGGDRITVKNLKILQVDKENNQIVLKGAVPGYRGTLVEIKVK
ncbi:MAG TPA: 50S ribosomal protein L3 [Candidatus Kaiserbacteria bacterium]|nr:50S ribosomal protein L3 [Candidatus Kaiserbacteria bacterium]